MMKTIKNFLIPIFVVMSFFAMDGNYFLSSDVSFSPDSAWAKKDKDKDDDEDIEFNYEDNNFQHTYSPCSITKIQIEYDKDFTATDAPIGPNILVEGTDNGTCTVKIEKISGGENCGWHVSKTAVNLEVQTDAINGEANCEMVITATIPRTVLIVPKL